MRKPKPKKVSYELIDPLGRVGEPMYQLLEELVTAHHDDLADARIGLAWCTSWKPDADGHVTLGKCRRASDLDRELSQWDFIILLRKSFWTDDRVTHAQRRALLDHELCHGALKFDTNLQPMEDERGRRVYRIRRHDIEEFVAIIERHGCYMHDLELFAAALRRSVLAGFAPCDDCRSTDHPGWTTTEDKRLKRCACWTTWRAQFEEVQAEATAVTM